jgi:hypothetical protein
VLLCNYWIPIGQQEDEWDAILRRECGFEDDLENQEQQVKAWDREDNGGTDGALQKPVKWADVMLQAFRENMDGYEKEIETDKAIAKKMLAIVDEETRLAKLEGQTTVRGRRGRPIKSRWPT